MATRAEVIRVLAVLGAAYPKEAAAYSEKTVTGELYIRLLADIPGKLLEMAALQHIGNSSWFPLIAELRKASADVQDAIRPFPDAYEAWAEVQNKIPSVGYSGKPEFSHPLIQEVANILGWRYLCLSENPVPDRAHFIQAYNARRDRSRSAYLRPVEVSQFIDESLNAPRLPVIEDQHNAGDA